MSGPALGHGFPPAHPVARCELDRPPKRYVRVVREQSHGRLVVLGAGGGVADIADLVQRTQAPGGDVELVGLLDDGVPVGTSAYGHEVLGRLSDWTEHVDVRFVHTMRSARLHARVADIVGSLGIPAERWVTLVDPDASVAPSVSIGRGSFVCPGAVVAPNVIIRDHVSIGPNATIGHDTTIADWTIVAPSAVIGGRVTVETSC
jgi:hypothetical protein